MSFSCSSLIIFAYIHSFIIFFLASLVHSDFYPGEVLPVRLEIAVGSSANITCRMNLTMFDGSDSNSLHFIESDTKKRVPSSDITIINASTIVYTLRNAVEQDRRYICLIGEKGIAESHVVVGTPPTEIKEFKCRGYNNRYMVCNFTIPHNTVDVKYELSYYCASPKYKHNCELERVDDGKYGICNITEDQRRCFQYYECSNFTLTGNNSLGNRIQSFSVNNFESEIPSRPELILTNKTNNSATFFWDMESFFYIKKGLKYEIHLLPEKFDWIVYTDYHVRRDQKGYNLELKNLPYAFYNYTLRLRIRVNSTKVDEDLWSKSSIFKFKTSSCLPDAPPTTDVGSFDLMDTTKPRVRLYWKQRPFYRENGENFQYNIQVNINGTRVQLDPIQIDRVSADFRWDNRFEYEFIIRSSNEKGLSLDGSRIVVPAINMQQISNYTPDWIRSIYRKSNKTFTIEWNPPTNENGLVDYTVFWCHPKPAISNECNDSVRFTHISKNITQFTTEPQQQEHAIIFAISANYVNFTTGMHWSMCTADITKDLTKLYPEFKPIASREVGLTWNLMKECPSILEGYVLTYCPVEDSASERCLEQSTSVTIKRNVTSHVIRGLKPYTPYKFEIYMYSEMKKGKPSDKKVIITKEEAPSPPRDLKLYNITSNSVLLSWLPPLETNGKLRSYTVVYCMELLHPQCLTNFVNASELSYKLELLSSYTYYSVYVQANTVEASSPSNIVYFKTLVGIPSSPRRLTLDKNNTILQWTQEDLTLQRVDFYEVSIELYHKNIKKEEHIYGVINATSCVFSKPSCIDKDYIRIVRVRAVTAVSQLYEVDLQLLNDNITDDGPSASYFTEDNTLKCNNTSSEDEQLAQWKDFHDSKKYIFYKSHWEKGITYGCGNPEVLVFELLYVAGVICAIIIGVFVLRTSYDKIKTMSAIGVRLPELLNNPPKDISTDQRSASNYNESDGKTHICIKEASIQNEQSRLLTSDSSYLPGSSDVSAMGISTPPILGYNGSNPLTTIDYCQADDFTKFTPAQAVDDAYTLMRIPKQNQEVIQMNRPMSSSIYVKPNQLCNISEDLITTSLANGTIINQNLMPAISSSGYVETRANRKPVNPASFVCYTTLDALNSKQPAPLSGYVKPKELLALGQHSFS